LYFHLEPVFYRDLSAYASHVAGLTDMYHHTQFTCRVRILLTCLPRLDMNHNPISASPNSCNYMCEPSCLAPELSCQSPNF
jgi:hypothetical protein